MVAECFGNHDDTPSIGRIFKMSEFVPFVPSPKVKVEKPAKAPRVKVEKPAKVAKPKVPLATIERNTSGNGFVLLISVIACRDLGLVVGDRVTLGYDSTTGRVGFRKDNNKGSHTLNMYGGNPDRLKTGITDFMKAKNLARHVTGHKVKDKVVVRDGWATIRIRQSSKPAAPEPVKKNKRQTVTAS